MITIDILYKILKDYVWWPSRENIRQNLPCVFRLHFPNTRVILDCTEVKIQKFQCVICRTRSYSHYKCCHTIKILIGIAPSGLISYVSPVFGGRTSDTFIFNYDEVLQKCEVGDAIMVDKGFMIQNECILAGIELIRPPFVGNKGRLSAEDCVRNNLIARARVHVERIMQRIKVFEIMRHDLHLSYLDSIDKIVNVICALVNLSDPILSDIRY